MSRRVAAARRLLPVLPVLACLSGCADDSFAVLAVTTYDGALDDVAQLRVHVTSDAGEDVLLFPEHKAQPLHLDTSRRLTLSVQFDRARSQVATFEVEALSSQDAVLGYGTSSARVGGSDVVAVVVKLVPGAVRPARGVDGGAPDGGAIPLACDPAMPTPTCGDERTCGLLCTQDQPAASMCYLAGAGSPGAACASNSDCAVGSQCFTFSAVGCSVKTCLRFCGQGADCGEAGATCNVPIHCGSTDGFAACSRPCDPTSTGGGCAAGLACFVYASKTSESTDCACPGLGGIGQACTQNSGCNGELGCAGCAAGLSCVIATASDGTPKPPACRPICNLVDRICPSGTSCYPFDAAAPRRYGFCQ